MVGHWGLGQKGGRYDLFRTSVRAFLGLLWCSRPAPFTPIFLFSPIRWRGPRGVYKSITRRFVGALCRQGRHVVTILAAYLFILARTHPVESETQICMRRAPAMRHNPRSLIPAARKVNTVAEELAQFTGSRTRKQDLRRQPVGPYVLQAVRDISVNVWVVCECT